MRKSEILDYWVGQYGPLSRPSRERFLRRQEVRRLTRYPDDLVKKAIRYSNLLADALSFAAILSNPPHEAPPDPRSTDAPPPVKRRPYPNDRALHENIGPVQNYEDDF